MCIILSVISVMQYNVLDLFCGCGGMSKGLVDAGLNVVAGIDVWDKAINSYKKNFEHQGICEDLTKLPPEVFQQKYNKSNKPIDIIVGGPPCFIAGTFVCTDNGYKKIEEVELNDKLLTHTGKFNRILNLQRKIYSGNIYELQIEHHLNKIYCTEEHPFYVRSMKATWDCSTKQHKIFFGEPEWKKAKDLTKNDYFGMIKQYDVSTVENVLDIQASYNDKLDSYSDALELQRLYLKRGVITDIVKTDMCHRNAYEIKIADNSRVFIENGYAWYPSINIVKKSALNVPVYNFEVCCDNSYVVENIIVHNCQGFSMAGKRDIKDPRNSLFMEYVKYIDYYKPKAFMMENVIGILSMRTKTDEKVIDIIMSKFESNYNCVLCKLYASDFYVPQNRRRVIIIGIRKDLNIMPEEPAPRIPKNKRRTVGSILMPQEEIDEKYYLSEKAIAGIIRRKKDCVKNGKGFGAQYLQLDKPSYTISARYWKDGYDALVKYSDTEIRKLTITELKRIQTFPDDYKILGSNKEIIMQIGNAVACKFAKYLGRHLVKTLQQ